MRTLELTRSGVLGTVAVFLVAALCIRLGFWQLERRADRLERNQVVASRIDAEPVTLPTMPPDTSGLAFRRAVVQGRADPGGTFVLAGRSLRGMPGVHVFTPVRLDRSAVLVNRGWLPAPDAASVDAASLRIDGPVTVAGILLPFPDVDLEGERAGFRATWFRLDGDAIRGQYGYDVAPLYLQATAVMGTPEAPADAPLPLDPPALGAGPHLAYAVQWFSFAAVFLLGWAALLMRSRSRPAGPDHRNGHPRPGPVDRP